MITSDRQSVYGYPKYICFTKTKEACWDFVTPNVTIFQQAHDFLIRWSPKIIGGPLLQLSVIGHWGSKSKSPVVPFTIPNLFLQATGFLIFFGFSIMLILNMHIVTLKPIWIFLKFLKLRVSKANFLWPRSTST